MTELYFASANQNKIKEVNALLPPSMVVRGIQGLVNGDLEETGETLQENALMKARAIYNLTGVPSFADDTGLEVDSLNGEPGVFSARYAGPQRNDADNINKLLSELKGKPSRKARFRTVIAFVNGDEQQLFEGIVNGRISEQLKGENGFGYDPVFVPDGGEQTFAEMSLTDKNAISHRGRAFRAFAAFMAQYA
ncbi:MAG: RdgB/HAM1 family non-canonical purine NTP pyrophosphatase [Bacteroidia bacterium]|nr:RdgB/HAM1 family non-canonical purine NTP pyrophosphatase [Bacteroidia bacterium]